MHSSNGKPQGTPAPRVERRSGVDRRKVDKGPPDRRERRRGIEPRKPEVVEREPTPSEWAILQEIPPRKPGT
jgi:hypothetical protein